MDRLVRPNTRIDRMQAGVEFQTESFLRPVVVYYFCHAMGWALCSFSSDCNQVAWQKYGSSHSQFFWDNSGSSRALPNIHVYSFHLFNSPTNM